MSHSSPILSRHTLDLHWPTADPFLFCAHHRDSYPRGNAEFGPDAPLDGRNLGQDFTGRDGWRMYHGEKVPGFPGHPHRGFETITIVEQGVVDHADSLGAAGRYSSGDVQWMTAGRGIQHSEMFPLLNRDSDNTLELFQIWLNLPAAGKMSEPDFTMFWHDEVPRVVSADAGGREARIRLIAGSLDGIRALAPPVNSWAAETRNEVSVWLLSLDPGAEFQLPVADAELNRFLYFYRGSELTLNGEKVNARQGMELRPELETTLVNGPEAASILFLQGRPIAEPVANYGPFVMNSREQLQQAFQDYQKDQFGGWPWPRQDQIHAADRGSFARYADGREEVPGAGKIDP